MNIIKKKRKEIGISQKELSEKLGTSQQTVSRIENLEIENIPCSMLVKLSEIFCVPIEFLLYDGKRTLNNTTDEELWEVYQKLDESNRETLILLGRRLQEVQIENASKIQIGEKSDKNCDM